MRSFLPGVVGLVILVGGAPAEGQPAPPPAAVVPTELTAAPAWIARQFQTGLIVREHTHTTHTLRRHGLQAMLTIETRSSTGMTMHPTPWVTQPVRTFVGTAEDKAKVVTLSLTNVADPSDTLAMRCKRTTIAAARPTAVRGPSPGADECGDEGRWSPATTRRVTVLRCDLGDDSAELAFAPSPGIEWLFVNDDCLQGGGWRQAPADRSIQMKVRKDWPAAPAPRKPAKPR